MLKPLRVSSIFLRDIPTDIKDQFKAVCAKRGKSMKEVLIAYMRQRVEDEYAIERQGGKE